ncbi:MAG: adenylyl-sulfate kinase [Nitrospiraceae bacterium]|uniref:adenylyl-sulfate kinase n=1 Tax=Nitrospira cf. moscoviensis SBR1015 TaxID=96242 RepID=UPI000A0EBF59|nr:adenylyl-sulfate kinase [Nitrospira cf. moscoviensis SBR1015]MBY0249354.1 adenylyl-sulfate kinase [Nitrospiraceae bacterium]OQW29969.1 MAG: hypothetical protein A4E20_04460 [Nitrospira sp. SG-bin2]
MWENKPKIAVDPASIGQSSLSVRFGSRLFCRALAFMGARLVAHGVMVIFDTTASRRAYRDFARSLIPQFIEVAVECPLELAMQRDYKGTYQRGRRGESSTVPGLQEPLRSAAPSGSDDRYDESTREGSSRHDPEIHTGKRAVRLDHSNAYDAQKIVRHSSAT